MRFFYIGIILLGLVSCTKKAADGPVGHEGATDQLSEYNTPDQMKILLEKGRATYVANCTSCHGVDPKKDGTLGPVVAGSSLELLEKRVIEGTYPVNYKPKRETRIMQKFPFLKNEIKALHAYLNKQ